MKAAFEDYLAEKKEVRAIFVGTRRTDPHGGSLTSFDATDHGWPPFMRVHPVIDWHYVEIWGVRARRSLRNPSLLQTPADSWPNVVYTAFGDPLL